VTNFATPPPPAAGVVRVYPAVFFPGVRTASEATAIDINFGDDRTGTDLVLAPVPAVRVSGRLEGFTGPAPALLLRMLPAGSEQLGVGSEAATTLVEPDGRFTFLQVPTGSYTILAQASVADLTTSNPTVRLPDPPGFPGGPAGLGEYEGAPGVQYLQRYGSPAAYWGRAPIAVGNFDITNAIVPIHPTVSIRGRAIFTGDTTPPPPTRRLVVNAFPADGDPTLGTPFGFTETDGTFRFSVAGLLGGTYLIRGFGSFSIVSVISQGRDVLDTGFDASSGRDIDDVVVTLTDRKTALTGLVSDSSGRADAAVLLFPTQRERWTDFGLRPLRFRTTRTNAGTYRFSTLTAGDYFLIAVEPAKLNEWVNPAFLAAAAPLARRITLKWGDTASQDLTVKDVVVK
jgi:hypothetical protein